MTNVLQQQRVTSIEERRAIKRPPRLEFRNRRKRGWMPWMVSLLAAAVLGIGLGVARSGGEGRAPITDDHLVTTVVEVEVEPHVPPADVVEPFEFPRLPAPQFL